MSFHLPPCQPVLCSLCSSAVFALMVLPFVLAEVLPGTPVCYSSPSVGSVQELALRSRVVIEGKVQEEERELRPPDTEDQLLGNSEGREQEGEAIENELEGKAFQELFPNITSISESYLVKVRVYQVWAVKAGGLEKDSLISVVGEFDLSCLKLKKDSRYIFFLEPTNITFVFMASFPPLETGRNIKKDVSRILCQGCVIEESDKSQGEIGLQACNSGN
nr:PREDICTED: pro-neuregulin-2, membrane-bound isoform-like [Latimeria chalumnae]|eukprot:XP_006013188.2 PREDICTED: pro-neuregulin-2, membrane-bound isoform-like [Latimeria chalumnae]